MVKKKKPREQITAPEIAIKKVYPRQCVNHPQIATGLYYDYNGLDKNNRPDPRAGQLLCAECRQEEA